MEKKCRKCKNPKNILEFPPMNIWKYWVWTTCFECIKDNHKKYVPIKRSQKKINSVSKTNKNNIAEFSKKTKDEIKERQSGICIISGDQIEVYHHAFYGAHYANYWSGRNNADQGVWLSNKVHYIIHHGKDTDKAKEYRAKCIIYLKELEKVSVSKSQ